MTRFPFFAAAAVAVALVVPDRLARPRAADARSLAVEFSGCARVDRGPVCVLGPDRRLVLFGAASLEVQAPAVEIEATPIADGVRRRVELPARASRLVVRDGESGRWQLALAAPSEPAALVDARRLRQEGRADDAEKLLSGVLPGLEPDERARATALLGRIQIARGAVNEGVGKLERSLDAAERAGRLSEAVQDAFAIAFARMVHQRRFPEARLALERAEKLSQHNPADRAQAHYYSGLLATETGDLFTALDRFREASRRAARLEVQPTGRHARHMLALVLAHLGRWGEALEILPAVISASADESPCNRASNHGTYAWALLGHGRASGTALRAAEAQRHLDQLFSLLDRACPSPTHRVNAELTAAEWALALGDVPRAARHVASARASEGPGAAAFRLWRLDLEGKLALARGDARAALGLFQRQAELARGALDFDAGWRAEVGRGRALERLGRPREAVDAYQVAETALDERLVHVPLSDGQESFAGNRDESARRLVARLVGDGRARDALRALRWARARTLRIAAQSRRVGDLSPQERRRWEHAIGAYRRARAALEAEARNDWELPADRSSAARQQRAERELAVRRSLDEAYRVVESGRAARVSDLEPPAPDELLLTFFPTEDGWLGIAATAERVTARQLGAMDFEHPAALLAGLGAEIRSARRVRVLAYGAARAVDLHAVPFDGRPLGAQVPVVYPLDLPRPARDGGSGALVVADPAGDLPRARAEGAGVAARLQRSESGGLELLSGSDARRERVLEALPRLRLLHFAGHGTFAGSRGVDSALVLADGRVSLGDVLAAASVPELVVLSACEAARSASSVEPESFGMAQAFLVRGAHAVIAPTRPVSDALATELMQSLYDELARDGDPASALQRAQQHISRTRPDSDWASFRVLVP